MMINILRIKKKMMFILLLRSSRMKINPLVHEKHSHIKPNFNIIIQQMLSKKPSIAFSLRSCSLSFIQPFLSHHHLIIFIIISSEDSLDFSLLMVVVVFNLSPLCIEKYFLSWHLLSWCFFAKFKPFSARFVIWKFLLNRILYWSGLCMCYGWSNAFGKALSRKKASRALPHFPIVVWMWLWLWKLLLFKRGEIVLFWKNVSALMFWFPNCYYVLVFLWEDATPTNLGIPLPNYLILTLQGIVVVAVHHLACLLATWSRGSLVP